MGRRVTPTRTLPRRCKLLSTASRGAFQFCWRNKQRFEATPRVEVSPCLKTTGAGYYYVTQCCFCLFRFVQPVFRLFIHARLFCFAGLVKKKKKSCLDTIVAIIITYFTYCWPGIRWSDLAGCLPASSSPVWVGTSPNAQRLNLLLLLLADVSFYPSRRCRDLTNSQACLPSGWEALVCVCVWCCCRDVRVLGQQPKVACY